jgi:hypothetical protein
MFDANFPQTEDALEALIGNLARRGNALPARPSC